MLDPLAKLPQPQAIKDHVQPAKVNQREGSPDATSHPTLQMPRSPPRRERAQIEQLQHAHPVQRVEEQEAGTGHHHQEKVAGAR